MSLVRQNFHNDCEALINKQINMELTASYVYLSMVTHISVELSLFHRFVQLFENYIIQ
jgi:ferritin heavy chain